jgi:hypothetical protein
MNVEGVTRLPVGFRIYKLRTSGDRGSHSLVDWPGVESTSVRQTFREAWNHFVADFPQADHVHGGKSK